MYRDWSAKCSIPMNKAVVMRYCTALCSTLQLCLNHRAASSQCQHITQPQRFYPNASCLSNLTFTIIQVPEGPDRDDDPDHPPLVRAPMGTAGTYLPHIAPWGVYMSACYHPAYMRLSFVISYSRVLVFIICSNSYPFLLFHTPTPS
jgi:hypothetical protein